MSPRCLDHCSVEGSVEHSTFGSTSVSLANLEKKANSCMSYLASWDGQCSMNYGVGEV